MKVLLHLIIYKAIVLGVCRLVVSSLVLVVLPGAGGGWWSPPWWLPSVEWSSESGGWWCPPWRLVVSSLASSPAYSQPDT